MSQLSGYNFGRHINRLLWAIPEDGLQARGLGQSGTTPVSGRKAVANDPKLFSASVSREVSRSVEIDKHLANAQGSGDLFGPWLARLDRLCIAKRDFIGVGLPCLATYCLSQIVIKFLKEGGEICASIAEEE